MRAKITLVLIILYILLVNGYMYGFYCTNIDKFYMKLFGYYWPILIISGYLVFDEMANYTSPIHRCINIFGKLAVWFNILLITFTYQLSIKEPKYTFFIFDGLLFVTLLMIFISGLHRGLFKKHSQILPA